MTHFAELELGLHRRDATSYAIEFRFSSSDSDTDLRLIRDGLAAVQFDLEALQQSIFDDRHYGQLLTQSLFGETLVTDAFQQAKQYAEKSGYPLRLRLYIGPTALALHALHWETLQDPVDGSRLATGERILFSRYLSSFDWHPVRLRRLADLKALVVIANPSNLSEYRLAPVDVAAELQRARTGLGTMPITTLSNGQATLDTIAACLRNEARSQAEWDPGEGGFDILYIVCHGAVANGKTWLWLENEEGKIARTEAQALVTCLKNLPYRPRIAVLLSCQSAYTGDNLQTGDDGALAALGPQLAEIGIPAVLAMQGNVSMETVAKFIPIFFTELRHDGQIDRAMAVARQATQHRPDWWVPVLFMRLKSGRIWYTPGFGDEHQGLRRWPAFVRNIQAGRCTPILGPGLLDGIFGSQREIARRWAEEHYFPLSPHQREDLPQVTQYLSITQDFMFPRHELPLFLRQALVNRFGPYVAPSLHQADISQLIAAVGDYLWQNNPTEPTRVLAQLPLPIYVTTMPDNLLHAALQLEGKAPEIEVCRWNEYLDQLPSIFDQDPDYVPSVERPLIFHLFGHFDEPNSLVLTEDDYFDYLIGVTKNSDLIPDDVRRALADTALLFLGFHIEDWNFRVLFRSIMSREGGSRRARYAHIAAQISPEEGRLLEPQRAYAYLEQAFSKDADISIYWGNVQDFAREIKERWQGKPS